jgi:hypothetical protein
MIPLWLFVPSVVTFTYLLLLCAFRKKDKGKVVKFDSNKKGS